MATASKGRQIHSSHNLETVDCVAKNLKLNIYITIKKLITIKAKIKSGLGRGGRREKSCIHLKTAMDNNQNFVCHFR